jgi:hypothetical protein
MQKINSKLLTFVTENKIIKKLLNRLYNFSFLFLYLFIYYFLNNECLNK